MAGLINQAETVAIFGGDGCEQAQDEVRELAARLKAPVGYSFKGKQWLEHDNPNAVGMTGLLGYGGCHAAINSADVLLMLGTDFPFTDFLPHTTVKTIQVDRDPGHIGRRAPLELGVVGDVAATLRAVAPMVQDKHGDHFLREHVTQTEHARRRLGHYVTKGPGLKPIRPEYVAAVLSELADDDAVFTVDTGTPCIWAGIRVEEPGDVRDALRAALAHTGGPVVVDMVVDRYALALPSHVPAATAKGFTLSLAKQVLSGKMDEVIETVEHNVRLL
jgi:pyruvate dehydrogenase (quinone)